MDAGVFGSITPLAPITTSTTRAKIAATDHTARRVLVQLDPDADKKHFIGDSTVVAAGTAGVICCLAAGQSAEFPLGSTSGLYVVGATGASAAKLYVSVVS
jgi:hypothetical protein